MDPDKLNDLLAQYLTGTLSKEEFRRLLDSIPAEDFPEVEAIVDKLVEEGFQPDPNQRFDQDAVLHGIWNRINKGRTHRKRWLTAATATLLICSSIFLYLNNPKKNPADKITVASDVLLPEQNDVILYLSDGSRYQLTQANQKTLREIGVEAVTSDGEETRFILTHSELKNTGLNTITNGKGHTCQLQLADGSRIWLNAGATLSYPIQFAKSQRSVSLAGEAFFQVARDANRPFEVSTAHTAVRVLGTQFNIEDNRAIGVTRTTLVEGAVEVRKDNHVYTLEPGWQATTQDTFQEISVDTVNLRDILAWKEGYFRFNDHTIDEVMAQVSTWYNVAHVYIDERTDDRFTGSVSKTQKLSEVLLQLAEISNYKFKINEGSVYVMK